VTTSAVVARLTVACWSPQAIQLINTLTKELDIHAAMQSVRHVALELLECERVTLFLIIESRQELRYVDRWQRLEQAFPLCSAYHAAAVVVRW
jgi:GAF domain-containing protein